MATIQKYTITYGCSVTGIRITELDRLENLTQQQLNDRYRSISVVNGKYLTEEDALREIDKRHPNRSAQNFNITTLPEIVILDHGESFGKGCYPWTDIDGPCAILVYRDRSDRLKKTSECFTPTQLVQEILDKLDQESFKDPTKTFLDPSCGDGQFLSEVLIRKLENGIDFETALSTIYGVDLMQDNVDLCRERLLCGEEHLRHIVEKNIVCANGLEYNYTFGEPESFGNGLFTFD